MPPVKNPTSHITGHRQNTGTFDIWYKIFVDYVVVCACTRTCVYERERSGDREMRHECKHLRLGKSIYVHANLGDYIDS